MNLPAELTACHSQDLIMIKGQSRHIIKRKPLGSSSIITAFHLLNPNESKIGYCYYTFAWVSVWCGKSVKLLYITRLKACLLFKLAQCTLLSALIHPQETTRQSPSALEWFYPSLNEKHFKFCSVKSKYHTVGSDAWMRIFVTIFKFVHNINV